MSWNFIMEIIMDSTFSPIVAHFLIWVGFLTIVLILPISLFFRYKLAKHRVTYRDSYNLQSRIVYEQKRLQILQKQADNLEKRLFVLESILDNKAPDWKRLQ